MFLSFRKYDTGSRIRILTFYPSRIPGSKRHRIPDLVSRIRIGNTARDCEDSKRECHPFPVWNEEWERECSFPTPQVGCWQTQCMYGHIIQTHPSLEQGKSERDGLYSTVYNSVQLQPFLLLWWVTESECQGRWVSSLTAEKFCETHSPSHKCALYEIIGRCIHSCQITLQNWKLYKQLVLVLKIKYT